MSKQETIRQMPRRRVVVLVLVAMVALALAASLLAAKPAHAANTPFTVNFDGDQGDINLGDGVCDVDFGANTKVCTLRAAIQEANLAPGADTINFNVGGLDVFKIIKPDSALPAINDRVTIDGYTQPGASPNTLAQGANADLRIVLDGTDAGLGANGLTINQGGSGSVVKGLVINNFGDNGISILGQTNRVEGNFIGTDVLGATAQPNTQAGVFISAAGSNAATNNIIGGTLPAARNVISGNFGGGVQIKDDPTNLQKVSNNSVLGNLIGTDKNGTGSLGNSFDGVSIVSGASDNSIGSASPTTANTIAFNQGAGVSVSDDSVGNRILRNSIFSNAGLGIDLNRDGLSQRDGVTANDGDNPATPQPDPDSDTGANNFQNFPVISSAKTSRKGTSIVGKLNSAPNKTFTLQFFASPEADDSGNGEGKTFLGETPVTTDASAKASFTVKPPKVPKRQFITVTATDSDGNTSEFSAAKKVVRKR